MQKTEKKFHEVLRLRFDCEQQSKQEDYKLRANARVCG
jgi:hypothetical protein